jgi:hypothetical protein
MQNFKSLPLEWETWTSVPLYPIPSLWAGRDVFEIKFIEVSVGIYIW